MTRFDNSDVTLEGRLPRRIVVLMNVGRLLQWQPRRVRVVRLPFRNHNERKNRA
jgi:hypothetical protein